LPEARYRPGTLRSRRIKRDERDQRMWQWQGIDHPHLVTGIFVTDKDVQTVVGIAEDDVFWPIGQRGRCGLPVGRCGLQSDDRPEVVGMPKDGFFIRPSVWIGRKP
jgi:hypothetical protein